MSWQQGQEAIGKYAGIGSRSTPGEILGLMERVGEQLANRGWRLRTGGAAGADQAFMRGAAAVNGAVELYLPWPGFQSLSNARLERPTPEAMRLAARFHPSWPSCPRAVKALHARNSHQVLGERLDDPVTFVCCWTPDGSVDGRSQSAGGTGQALRIAFDARIRVFNLARDEHRSRVEMFCG